MLEANTCKEKFNLFFTDLSQALDRLLPQKVVKKHPTDKSWITSKIKKGIFKRQSAFIQQWKMSSAYRFWRNKVQQSIRTAKHRYYNTKVTDVKKVNPAKWWKEIKRLSGQSLKPEWHHQFLENSFDTKLLTDRINSFFTSLTDGFDPLTPRTLSQEVLQEFFVNYNEVYSALSSLQINKAVGPSKISNRVLKEFVFELTPIIKDIYNQSMREVIFLTSSSHLL